MASVNQVMLLGNLGRDCESFQASSGTVVYFPLATSRKYRSQSGEEIQETEWSQIVCFGSSADIAMKYLKKGDSVFIQGRLHTRKYTDKSGIDRYKTEVICERLVLTGNRSQGQTGYSRGYQAQPGPDPQSEEDIPF
nr:MAG TPA: Single strand binding protein [Caudoviricetes sp.]